MSVHIPQECIKKVHQCQRSFIWGDSLEKKHVHSIRWSTISKEKHLGGLGLRNLSIMNKVCLAKLGWNLKAKGNSLWCNLMKSNYAAMQLAYGSISAKPYDSCIWKTIVDLRPKLEFLSYWEMGNNSIFCPILQFQL